MKGELRINWAGQHMPVLRIIADRFAKTKPFDNIRISACLHVTAETANLIHALKVGGAQVSLCASNPLSTQDDVVAALKRQKINTFAKRGADRTEYYRHLKAALANKPHLTVDDGADLVTYIHTKAKGLLKQLIGGTEETTTGVMRLKAMASAGKLRYPLIAVNAALTKHLFDNRYGTGQSTIDGIIRATNVLLAGKIFVVAGYGWCGKGVSMRARGLGARVMVTEVDPVRALEAVMDGFEVTPMNQAARIGDIFVTATGDIDVITRDHIKAMKDGAIVANTGHFDVEVDVKSLRKMSKSITDIRPNLAEYVLKGNKRVYLLAEGRLVNLSAAEGHPSSVMDMSFANQALSLEYLVNHHKELKPAVYDVPAEIDVEIARLKLAALKVGIDKLTPKQQRYLAAWQEGT